MDCGLGWSLGRVPDILDQTPRDLWVGYHVPWGVDFLQGDNLVE